MVVGTLPKIVSGKSCPRWSGVGAKAFSGEMPYDIIVKPAAEKSLDEVPFPVRRRIVDAMKGLRTNPRPPGV